jgi:hypothetical protein
VLRIVRPKETSQIAVVTGSERNKWDNLNIRRGASRHFRNKKREYLKEKINKLAKNSENKNIRDLHRGINKFKRGYQPTSNLVKCEKYSVEVP